VIFPLLVVGAAALVTRSAALSRLAALDVAAVRSGELWRVVTGHLSHLTWRHFVIDSATFFLLYAAYQRKWGTVATVALAAGAAAAVSLSVVFAGMHDVYGGLSGLSCAPIAATLAFLVAQRPRQVLPYLLSAGYLGFLAWGTGGTGVDVAREAHFGGAALGAVFGGGQAWLARGR